MKASVITVGDELLIGQVVNTNAAWIGERLTDAGFKVVSMDTVGDDAVAISEVLELAVSRSEFIVMTGGMGPTHDDITKQAVAEFFGRELGFDEDLFERVREMFEKRGRHMPESNRSQAMVPEGFETLPNPLGTAPGLWFDLPGTDPTRTLVILPGVPYEMKRLLDREVLPRISGIVGQEEMVRRTILTTGIGESHLQELIGHLDETLDARLKLAYLPGLQGVRLRISATSERDGDADERLERLAAMLYQKIGEYIYGEGEMTLEAVVGELMKNAGLSVAVAESCTGGLITSLLTDVPGASRYVVGGVSAYSNSVKTGILGVSQEILLSSGAVSRDVAIQMAEGVRDRLHSNIGISTTGILGPTGGTEEKPVGTVWIGYADANGSRAVRLRLGNDRSRNKIRASIAALNMLRIRLLKQDRNRTPE